MTLSGTGILYTRSKPSEKCPIPLGVSTYICGLGFMDFLCIWAYKAPGITYGSHKSNPWTILSYLSTIFVETDQQIIHRQPNCMDNEEESGYVAI